MALSTYKELVDATLDGKTCTYYWRKQPSLTTTQGIWFDISMSPGMPIPQYYAATPLKATPMSFSSDRGIFHGYNVSPATKYLRKITTLSINVFAPVNMYLLDYLMYYPFVDEGTTDPQPMDNTNTLPRYTDGKGVQIMIVSQGARNGGQFFTVSYTNQDGVSGRTTVTTRMNTETANGNIISSQKAVVSAPGPFLTLQEGDTGVRSIDSVTMTSADIGLFALVLVKPIAQHQIIENTAVCEKDFLIQGGIIPQIQDDAYLNWIVCANGSLANAILQGDLTVTWT